MEQQTLGQTILAIFLAPTKAFEGIAAGVTWKTWVYPLIIVSIILSVVPLVYRDISLSEGEYKLKQAEKRWAETRERVPVERQEKIDARFEKGRKRLEDAKENPWQLKQLAMYLLIPVTLWVLSALYALILMGVGNFGMGGKVPFFQLFSVVMLSYLIGGSGYFFSMAQGIGSLEVIVKAPFIIMKESSALAFSPGLFFDKLDSFIKIFLNQLDLFQIWATAVLGIGFARLYGKSTGTGIVTVGIVWLILTAVGSGLIALNPGA